jgi:hypothetical protein
VILDDPKRGYKIFSMFEAHGSMWRNYEILFTKVFHILVYLAILNIQCVSLNKHTSNILSRILSPKKIPMDYINK